MARSLFFTRLVQSVLHRPRRRVSNVAWHGTQTEVCEQRQLMTAEFPSVYETGWSVQATQQIEEVNHEFHRLATDAGKVPGNAVNKTGNAKANFILGGRKNDRFDSREGADTVYGGAGDDVGRLGQGRDTFIAGDGNDRLELGRGRDLGVGGAGNDVFVPGDDRDTDVMYGGEGADTFEFGDKFGFDLLIDPSPEGTVSFQAGIDRLGFVQVGNDLEIRLNAAGIETADTVLFADFWGVPDRGGWVIINNGRHTALGDHVPEYVAPSEGDVIGWTRQFDFGTIDSPLDPNSIRVTSETRYSQTRGYGLWSGDPLERDRGRADDLQRDFIAGQKIDFVTDVENGTYDVTVTIGDRNEVRQRMLLSLNGLHRDEITSLPGQFIMRTYRINVVDAQIRLQLEDNGGTTKRAVLNAVKLQKVGAMSQPVVNERARQDASIVVLTHGFQLPKWTQYLGLADHAKSLFGDLKDVVSVFRSGSAERLADSIKNIAEHIKGLRESVRAMGETRVPDWVFNTASQAAKINREDGTGRLRSDVVPVKLERIEKSNVANALQLWKGSRDFLALDWTDASSSGVAPFFWDIDEAKHREAVRRAGDALFKMIKARVNAELERDPQAKVDLLLVAHSFGTNVHRYLIRKLDESAISRHLDYVKVTHLDPVAVRGADKYNWYHPEMNTVVDAVTSVIQTVGLEPTGILEDQLALSAPLDGQWGGGPLGFFNRQGRVWDVDSNEETLRWRHWNPKSAKIADGPLMEVAYSPGGSLIASSDTNGFIHLRHVDTGFQSYAFRHHANKVEAFEFFPDGQHILSAGAGGALKITNIKTGTVVWSGMHRNVTEVAISPDGTSFVTGGGGGGLRLWQESVDAAFGKTAMQFENTATVSGHRGRVNELAITDAGVLYSVSADKRVLVWNISAGSFQQIQELKTETRSRGVVVSPNGQTVVVASGKNVYVYNAADNGRLVLRQVLMDHVDKVQAVTISRDGQRLATGGHDRTIFTYDLLTLQKVQTNNSAMLAVRDLSFSPDGGNLAATYFNRDGGAVQDLNFTEKVKDKVESHSLSGRVKAFLKLAMGLLTQSAKGIFAGIASIFTSFAGFPLHIALPGVWARQHVGQGKEGYFLRRDNPRASRPGDLGIGKDMAHTENRPFRHHDGVLTIDGRDGADNASVAIIDGELIARRDDYQQVMPSVVVNKLRFFGHEGADWFENDTAFPSIAAGGRGSDVLIGGSANDILRGGPGADELHGREGDDELNGGRGQDMLNGGAGDDLLSGGAAADVIFGGDGNDRIRGQKGPDTIFGGIGNDVIRGGNGADEIHGDDGDDQIFGGAGGDRIFGGDGNDRIRGQKGPDTIFGGNGNDVIRGGNGADEIYGDDGDDELHGGAGRDRLFGGAGNDSIRGNRGRDELFGGLGDDVLQGGAGADVMYGAAGDDELHGGKGADSMNGGDGNDVLFGGRGNDFLFGGLGNDRIYGQRGIDELWGGGGQDILDGGLGKDRFEGIREGVRRPGRRRRR